MESTFDLVTGGAGFIGSHLVDALLAAGRRVTVVDNYITGNPRNLELHKNHPKLKIINADITNFDAMKSICKNAERIFHLAAKADIVASIQNPLEYYHSNVHGTLSMLEAARFHEVKRFIYIASSTCYGFPQTLPTPENSKIDPQYPYALTKHLGEQLVMHWHKVYKIPALSLRFFNVYGPRACTTGSYGTVFGVFLAQILGDKPLTIVGDGNQARDFTYVGDVIDAILTASESSKDGEIYNVGSGGDPVSINYLAELLKAKEIVYIPKRLSEPDITWADVTKINKELNWQAKTSIHQGVEIMLNHIDHWKEAPIWTPETIAVATKDWFNCLESATI